MISMPLDFITGSKDLQIMNIIIIIIDRLISRV